MWDSGIVVGVTTSMVDRDNSLSTNIRLYHLYPVKPKMAPPFDGRKIPLHVAKHHFANGAHQCNCNNETIVTVFIFSAEDAINKKIHFHRRN